MDLQDVPVVAVKIADGFKFTFNGPIHTNVSWIEREFDQVIDAKPKIVELDLASTEYISSLGLGLLVNLHNRVKANGGVVKVILIRKKTMHLLRTAFLDRLLAVAPGAVIEPQSSIDREETP